MPVSFLSQNLNVWLLLFKCIMKACQKSCLYKAGWIGFKSPRAHSLDNGGHIRNLACCEKPPAMINALPCTFSLSIWRMQVPDCVSQQVFAASHLEGWCNTSFSGQKAVYKSRKSSEPRVLVLACNPLCMHASNGDKIGHDGSKKIIVFSFIES